MNHDIVYLLKDGPNEELRYSLRSVEKNFPHKNVIFVGGCPKHIHPDVHLRIEQTEPTKWANTRRNLITACKNPGITDDFWLFNDDFFIMNPYKGSGREADNTLWHHIATIENRHMMTMSKYTLMLRHCAKTLRDAGVIKPLNYAVHRPMLINKQKALEILGRFPSEPMFRSLYGNLTEGVTEAVKDVKITSWSTDRYEGAEIISTEDKAFASGDVGKYIRNAFPDRSKWED